MERKFKNIPILDGKKFNKVEIKGISWIDMEVSIKNSQGLFGRMALKYV